MYRIEVLLVNVDLLSNIICSSSLYFIDITSIISNIIGGLISGCLLIFIGYKLWKKQVEHQKKIELYSKAISTLTLAQQLIYNIILTYRFGNINVKTIFEKNIETFRDISKISAEFRLYFDFSYQFDFIEFKNIMNELLIAEHYISIPEITEEEKKDKYDLLIQRNKHDNTIMPKLSEALRHVEQAYNTKNRSFTKIKSKKKNKKSSDHLKQPHLYHA